MSSNRKVYARQVPWEWQESPWDDEQLKTDKAALYGNRSYGRYVFDEFEQVVKALEEMDWDDVGDDRPYSTEQEMGFISMSSCEYWSKLALEVKYMTTAWKKRDKTRA